MVFDTVNQRRPPPSFQPRTLNFEDRRITPEEFRLTLGLLRSIERTVGKAGSGRLCLGRYFKSVIMPPGWKENFPFSAYRTLLHNFGVPATTVLLRALVVGYDIGMKLQR